MTSTVRMLVQGRVLLEWRISTVDTIGTKLFVRGAPDLAVDLPTALCKGGEGGRWCHTYSECITLC